MENSRVGILKCECNKEFYYQNKASDVLVQILRVINHLHSSSHGLEQPRWFRSTENEELMRDRITGQIIIIKRLTRKT